MSSSICDPSTSSKPAGDGAADAHDPSKSNRQRRLAKTQELMSRHRESERMNVQFCKRPSELRSRRTPKGTIIRLSELEQHDLEQCLEDESVSRKTTAESATGRSDEVAGTVMSCTVSESALKAIEVPLLSLVINKRRGKSKAILDEYDVISKPGSRAIITLDDEDQEFLDAWAPEYYVEPHQDQRYPLYSDVLRGSLGTTS